MIDRKISSLWKQAFRSGFEERYIELAINSYKEILNKKIGKNPWENTRRNMLCSQMQKDKFKYGITFNIAPERGVWDENFKDKGRIDICCYLNQLDDWYIAFECKRFLKTSLVPSYIKDQYYAKGIKRFEDNIYSKNINIGGMIAFLEEGDFTKLNKTMNKELTRYSINNQLEELSDKYKHSYVYKTAHLRKNNGNIKLVHILMNFSPM